MIIKLGEKTVFKESQPDADEVYNKNLKLVCEKPVRFRRQDIEVGKAVRPQLASRVKNAEGMLTESSLRVTEAARAKGDDCSRAAPAGSEELQRPARLIIPQSAVHVEKFFLMTVDSRDAVKDFEETDEAQA
ncbi:hypothetical protein SELMODRAFT_422856 [Selaginella moellendorffii]|uniref:Uncharacterized protein n=1 Tax=Selaginella moellendorffii TaxID=88036 RepID=D8SJS3_SELML|nr:hypothetical protein SELMODRAFT_422856 [Selaginella moellendorffii]